MVTFFRKIRRWLLAENKLSRYFIYAAGEIFLVIVGILIALQINNANEIRKKEKTTIEIFEQIQEELAASIEESNKIIEFYRLKDSLIYLVLNYKVTFNDYKGNGNLIYLIDGLYPFNIQDNGFKKLTQYIDYTPKGTKLLMKKLNQLYINEKGLIDDANKFVYEFVTGGNSNTLMENKDWFWKLDFFGIANIDSVAINYFLTDPIYKNYVSSYSSVVINNIYLRTLNFRTDAIEVYNEISKIIKSENITETENFPFYFNVDNYKKWIGKYRGNDNGEDFILEITIEDGIIYGKINDNSKMEIFPLTNTKFYLDGDRAFISLTIDENKKIKSLKYNYQSENIICIKIE